jgi:hypothetical protein
MKANFSSSEKTRIRSFAEWGRVPQKNGEPRASVIVLTGLELFSNLPIQMTWKDKGGKYAALTQRPSINLDDLWTLADITQQLYLDLPSYSQWQQSRWRRKKSKRT